MLEAMDDQRLFDDSDVDDADADDRYYFVVGVRADAWDSHGKDFIMLKYFLNWRF